MRFLLPYILAATATIPPLTWQHRVLPNGLEVYAIPDRSTPTVAIHVWYRVGGKHDPDKRSGFAHLFEHMMFKSTKNMPSEMLDRLTEDVGGWNNATTLEDATAYYEVVPANYLGTLLWAEAERMGSLNVDDANFASERDVVKEEFRSNVLGAPYGKLFYALDAQSFTQHPYRRPPIGSIEDLDAATLDDVRAFHTTWYRPDNAVLIVAGDFEQKELDATVDRYFGTIDVPAVQMPRTDVAEPVRTEEKRVTEYGSNVPLPGFAMSWQAPRASDADAAALAATATLLTEGESSRLRERMVRGEIAQEVYADAALREDLGMFAFLAIMASGHAPAEAEKIVRDELAALAAKPPSAAELEKVKNLILTGALRELETSHGKAFALGQTIVRQRDPKAVNTRLARVQALTPEDIQRVVKKYLIEGKPVVINYLDEEQRQ